MIYYFNAHFSLYNRQSKKTFFENWLVLLIQNFNVFIFGNEIKDGQLLNILLILIT